MHTYETVYKTLFYTHIKQCTMCMLCTWGLCLWEPPENAWLHCTGTPSQRSESQPVHHQTYAHNIMNIYCITTKKNNDVFLKITHSLKQILWKHRSKIHLEYGVFPEPFNWSSHLSPFLDKKERLFEMYGLLSFRTLVTFLNWDMSLFSCMLKWIVHLKIKISINLFTLRPSKM